MQTQLEKTLQRWIDDAVEGRQLPPMVGRAWDMSEESSRRDMAHFLARRISEFDDWCLDQQGRVG